ncbi:3170_t:CDS:1 [Paraglomus brasilianum]|uniref:3170_t:CDS:1 n=1 Tax=Paraglomus brasilianum TaxID=144538 RepID=A0A9N9FLM7_9GLOM|nr:3170_t:CDS:1 [Paraglomus brasilianum]
MNPTTEDTDSQGDHKIAKNREYDDDLWPPRLPLTPFLFYVAHMTAMMSVPINFDPLTQASQFGTEWQAMTPEERAPWEKKAEKDKEKYDDEIADYLVKHKAMMGVASELMMEADVNNDDCNDGNVVMDAGVMNDRELEDSLDRILHMPDFTEDNSDTVQSDGLPSNGSYAYSDDANGNMQENTCNMDSSSLSDDNPFIACSPGRTASTVEGLFSPRCPPLENVQSSSVDSMDENAEPPLSYYLFAEHVRSQVWKMQPRYPEEDINILVHDQWNQLTPTGRFAWEAKANELISSTPHNASSCSDNPFDISNDENQEPFGSNQRTSSGTRRTTLSLLHETQNTLRLTSPPRAYNKSSGFEDISSEHLINPTFEKYYDDNLHTPEPEERAYKKRKREMTATLERQLNNLLAFRSDEDDDEYDKENMSPLSQKTSKSVTISDSDSPLTAFPYYSINYVRPEIFNDLHIGSQKSWTDRLPTEDELLFKRELGAIFAGSVDTQSLDVVSKEIPNTEPSSNEMSASTPPKLPKPAFLLFSKELLPKLWTLHSPMPFSSISKTIVDTWYGLTLEDRQEWEEKEQLDRDRFLMEQQAYESCKVEENLGY